VPLETIRCTDGKYLKTRSGSLECILLLTSMLHLKDYAHKSGKVTKKSITALEDFTPLISSLYGSHLDLDPITEEHTKPWIAIRPHLTHPSISH